MLDPMSLNFVPNKGFTAYFHSLTSHGVAKVFGLHSSNPLEVLNEGWSSVFPIKGEDHQGLWA